jgi:predicted DNA-binding protein YlxM (UPF0122 family)
MNDLTINEIANKLNVTKQCIYQKIYNSKELEQCTYKKDGVKYVTFKGFKIINDSLNGESSSKKKETSTDSELNTKYINDLKNLYDSRIADLKEEIQNLRKMNESIQKESDNKNKLLENMQVLLKDQKENKIMLNSKKNKWKFWKKD